MDKKEKKRKKKLRWGVWEKTKFGFVGDVGQMAQNMDANGQGEGPRYGGHHER